MYFSLVKLFKWTFSDYASDYAMQVLHMQNLANIKLLIAVQKTTLTLELTELCQHYGLSVIFNVLLCPIDTQYPNRQFLHE